MPNAHFLIGRYTRPKMARCFCSAELRLRDVDLDFANLLVYAYK